MITMILITMTQTIVVMMLRNMSARFLPTDWADDNRLYYILLFICYYMYLSGQS